VLQVAPWNGLSSLLRVFDVLVTLCAAWLVENMSKGVHEKKRASRALRENLESIAIAIVLAMLIRQVVVEAFKIPTGSMAPTLLGVHKEIKCPNCGWSFNSGIREINATGGVSECPNCHYLWDGASSYCPNNQSVRFRRPAWLWNEVRCPGAQGVFRGIEGANRIERGGSRILVTKFIYRLPWRKPRRWEVVVFLFPQFKGRCKRCRFSWESRELPVTCPDCGSRSIRVERRNFIKRLVGLPGEKIQLVDGDLYINGKLESKPTKVQKQLWFHVFDSLFWPRTIPEGAWPAGKIFKTDEHWTRSDGVLTVDAKNKGFSMARYGRIVSDHYGYDSASADAGAGYGAISGEYRVDDLAISADIVPERAGNAVFVIGGRDGTFTASIPVGDSAKSSNALLYQDGAESPITSIPVSALGLGRRSTVDFWLVDRRCYLFINERPVFSKDIAGRTDSHDGAARQTVAFGAKSARIRYDRVRIKRDIYYTPGGRNLSDEVQIKPDHYVFLGDNSPDSNDSRSWDDPQIPKSMVAGRAVLSFWPVHESRSLPAVKDSTQE